MPHQDAGLIDIYASREPYKIAEILW